MLTAENAKARAKRIKIEKEHRRERIMDEMHKRTIEFCDNQLTSDILDTIDRGYDNYHITLACNYNRDLRLQSVIPTTDVLQEHTDEQWINEGLLLHVLQAYLRGNGYKIELSEENCYNVCYITISWE